MMLHFIFLLFCILLPKVLGECCWAYNNPGLCTTSGILVCCQDCSTGNPCCGLDKCNFFCCNCPKVGSFVCKVGGTCTVLPFNGRSLASRNVDIFNHIYPHPNGKGIPHTILENCDSDKDSKISHDEMVRCYKEQHPLKNLTEIFIELDVNKDGFISIKEIDADADL